MLFLLCCLRIRASEHGMERILNTNCSFSILHRGPSRGDLVLKNIYIIKYIYINIKDVFKI